MSLIYLVLRGHNILTNSNKFLLADGTVQLNVYYKSVFFTRSVNLTIFYIPCSNCSLPSLIDGLNFICSTLI